MPTTNLESTTQFLIALNQQIGEKEQEEAKATGFFEALLSDQLIFRRASGVVVGKSGEGSFLESLATKPSPFILREAEEIAVTLLDGRALVTLIVVGTKADGTKKRYRNVRLFSRAGDNWKLELWYNYELSGEPAR